MQLPPSKREILVVEDTPASLKLLSDVLTQAGYYVRQAPNGELALWTALSRPPELILLDVRMPDIDGFEVCRRLKLEPRLAGIPVIFLSAQNETENRVRGFQLGAVDFIGKPFQSDEILARTDAHVRLARAQKALAAERALLEERVAERTGQLRLASQVFQNTLDAIIITDGEGRVATVNPGFTRCFGYEEAQVVGHGMRRLLAADGERDVVDAMQPSLLASGHWSGELTARRQNGELCPGLVTVSVVRDAQGAPGNYVVVFTDITERKAGQERIDFLSFHDALTGLPNRLRAHQRFDQMLGKRRGGRRVAVLSMDLDWFKNINDSYGQATGDRVLQAVARALADAGGEGVVVARQGGDEFHLLVPDDAQCSRTLELVGRLQVVLAAGLQVDGQHIVLGTSIGIAVAPPDGEQFDALVRNADTALLRSKESGRGGYAFFTECMDADIRERLSIAGQLRGAIERGEFAVHYQPQVCLRTGVVQGAEALLRWTNPELGRVPPNRFIPLAEEYGMINAIGDWVLDSVCRQMRAWQDAGLGAIKVAVNLSAAQFEQDCTVPVVQLALAQHGVAPASLCLEITESTMMGDPAKAAAALQRLKQLGVALSLDDFGTGYSSLAYLKRLPIDVLKIDKSFVDDVTATESDAAIARSIIALAHNLGMRVIAEGVETRAQAAFLVAHGCDEMQGYLFSPALPVEEFTTLMKEKRTLPDPN